MKQIGFSNYKRFRELPPLDLGRVTLIVGANNSGKSTFIKGLLLGYENTVNLILPKSYGGEVKFKGFENPTFSFDLNKYNAGVSTFGRSLNNEAENKSIEFTIGLPLVTVSRSDITFVDVEHQGFVIKLEIVHEDIKSEDGKTTGRISKIYIEDCGRQYFYTFDFVKQTIKFEVKSIDYHELMQPVTFGETPGQRTTYSIFSNVKNAAKVKLDNIDIAKLMGAPVVASVTMPMEDYIRYRQREDGVFTRSTLAHYVENVAESLIGPVGSLMSDFEDKPIYNDDNYGLYKNKKTNPETEKEILNLISFERDIVSFIKDSARDLDEAIHHEADVIYVPIHSITRSVWYNINDKNDFIAYSINNYLKAISNQNKKKSLNAFIRRWIERFEIGVDFRIKAVDGEFYSFSIITSKKKDSNISDNRKNSIHLADLGTGAIQIIILLLNIACAMAKSHDKGRHHKSAGTCPTIIVEEPEQNLHPEFQSKLAELFYEVSENINIIAETHSEYLIRKVQVIVAEQSRPTNFIDGLTDNRPTIYNPFKVYYFPKDEDVFDMGLHDNGWFDEKFGTGFLDEADKSHMAILSLSSGRRRRQS